MGLLAVTVFLLGLVAAVVGLIEEEGPPHPDEWDPRVAELAAYVEGERDLRFDHPVFVDFLSAQDYSEQTTDDPAALEEDDRAELDRYAGELRALGVASGPIDLFEALNQVSDAGTLAFYNPDDDRVRVRGTEMTVGLEVTIIHELTHALQDQHFDLSPLFDDSSDGSSTAFRGLLEGDAVRVEDAYVADELSEEERVSYEEEYGGLLDDSEQATGDVPPFVQATFGAPYALGQPFVTMLLNQDGNNGVDDAFENPPEHEEHLFDPASYLADEGAEEDVELGFGPDEELFDEGAFGATTWYLFLAERIDPKQAFTAALGWNGDSFAAVDRDGTTCLRAAFVGDSDEDEQEMAEALDAWLAAMPGGAAKVEKVDGHNVLEACDPGEELDLGLTGRSEDSLFLPNLWGYLVADAATVVGADQARCYAGAIVGQLTYEQITDPDGAIFDSDDFERTVTAAVEGCR